MLRQSPTDRPDANPRWSTTAATSVSERTAGEGVGLPLTTALLEASSRGLSFATPGHRGGRSCAGAR